MDLYLTIDRGNTMTKLAVWDGRDAVVILNIVNATTKRIVEAVDGYKISRAILCTVAGEFEGLGSKLGLDDDHYVVLSGATPLPIAVGYKTPQTLGSDRLAAAVGAWTLYPDKELLIVDIGTAATYDRLTADGCYMGGNIAPGIGMRLRALHHFTARLPLVTSGGEVPLWGFSTETAMRAGAIRGVCAEICYYRSCMPEGTVTILTGGWGRDIAGMLDFDVEVRENLVLIGLNRILQYNEID